ncbi:tRNA (adenosine(37)-N6)-threonylcarbamoyltransferase complex ATPase subunit type 1 TsaE [Ginsengibacter hankyongi]|uniref:tRNA threonylcarbamoyladenosine biosynthesis protein TsaE n=1 Tax=Ginsengibacter hankyongi TaxID=2607284 RepID=A0A5J5IKN4_9BACT|nr:tRNA (adenosine(37)-N6)-threonylcarbamoyltransferase complex ATPase subunit type 1 TsaE [Ginsengibacter hankyongi]KAA9041580.1 tRNA (adenosine(37)-N6)-threonylcarbamoyltransferase complex ATPase subunit type 1 TsaE [Ginsengibacter hankyongi]
MEFIFDLNNIQTIANNFISLFDKYKIIAFSGELGAGKTTLINAICKQLGVNESVTSPTYSIIQEYYSDSIIIYHMDLYRIKSIEEAIEAGIEDCLQSKNLCLVEWPEKAMSLFPGETVYASLKTVSNSVRKLIVQLPQ